MLYLFITLRYIISYIYIIYYIIPCQSQKHTTEGRKLSFIYTSKYASGISLTAMTL